jgi:RHS repeat-associated protein
MEALVSAQNNLRYSPDNRSEPRGSVRYLRFAMKIIARILLSLIFALCVLVSPSKAQSTDGWYGSGVGYFGGDYVAAAIASMHHWYPWTTNPDRGMFFSSPTQYYACSSWVAGSQVCGLAELECFSPKVSTINGCLPPPKGYQGKPGKKECIGDPINITSGNLYEEANDATTAAPSLTARRFYNSDMSYIGNPFGARPGRFGYGWRSEYDRSIIFNSAPPNATQLDVLTPEGTPLHFVFQSSAWMLAYWNESTNAWSTTVRHDVYYTLTTDGTYWYLKSPDDTVDKFDNNGRLVTITQRGGYTQTFTYAGSGNNTMVADSLGRQISFTYSTAGLATSLTDADGKVTQYTYLDRSPGVGASSLLVLETVVFPASVGTPTITYLYEDTNSINRFALTGITDENGHRSATWTYDSTTGRALSSQHAGGADLTTVSYDGVANTRTVTNALGKQSIYHMATNQGELQVQSIEGLASAHCPAATVAYLYDSNGFVSQTTSGEGRVNQYIHNSVGQETSRTEGYGTAVARTITTTWNTVWRAPDRTVAPNITTDYAYDTSGRLAQLTLTDTTFTTAPYSTNGQARIWNYTYYSNGLLHTVDGPLSGTGDTTTYAYDATGFVNSVTDVLGHTTTIGSNNGRGQPLSSLDANGIATNYAYDLRGRVTGITVNPGANQAVYGFTYDNAGNLTVVTNPDSSSLIYTYDNANRVTAVTNNAGEYITYTLDALGGRTATVIRSASSTITKQESATFDELGRILTNIGAASQTTTHAYDKDNNEITTTDPRSKIYSHAFDALNRLYQETDPDLFHTTTAFDAQDNPVSVTDARSLTTTYIRNGFGDVIRQTSPDTGITDFWYDANDAVIKQVDARQVETDFTNDNAGRVLTRTYPAASAENITYTYDSTAGGNKGIGNLTSVSDQSGSAAFVYDALGRVSSDTRVIAGHSYATGYTYDPVGNILTETYPSGRIVTYTRDALGRISGISTKQNAGASAVTVVSSPSYRPFGPLAGFTFGNGVVSSMAYDQDYQLTGINAANGATTIQNLTNGFDPSSNITSITDNLTSARSQTVTYDNLNRIKTAGGIYGAQTYAYDGVGNRSSLAVGATTSSYSYSPAANQITAITNAAAPPSTGIGSYLYNAFRQRVQKVAGGVTTQFVYDEGDHLIAEANGSGAVQKEYIWLDDMPVAMVDSTGASPVLYFIHTDQLGTPQKLTDGSMNVAWDGVFDPFGNPAPGASLALSNLRFPGQYADGESALNQNWNRDYDPITGRYIQSDPLGLIGGLNTYAYADGNPNSESDPDGQFGVAGALVGGGIDLGIQLLMNGGNLKCVSWTSVGLSAALGAVTGGTAKAVQLANAWRRAGRSMKATNAVRRYRRAMDIPKAEDVHHWLIPTASKAVPDFIKNHPINFNPIPRGIHQQIHNEFTPLRRWWYGWPGWAKIAVGAPIAGAAGDAVDPDCGCQ